MIPTAGLIGFSHSDQPMGRMIQFGEWMRFRRGSHWNHQFAVSDMVDVDGTPFVIQATLRGVTDTARLDEMKDYVLVEPPDGVTKSEMLVFLKQQVGIEYGFLTILAIALDIITWDWFPAFRGSRKPSWICSALINEAMRFAGWLHQWVNIYTVTPAQGYLAITGTPAKHRREP